MHPARLSFPAIVSFALLLLLGSLTACSGEPCTECFSIEVGQPDGSWATCCDYTRANAEDPLLLRLTRIAGDDGYTAGLAFGCAWAADSPPFEPGLVTRDGAEVDGWDGFGLEFDGVGAQSVVSIDCDPVRPPPAWPLVLINLLDPDLAAQFDPEAEEGEAQLVVTPLP
jgi:hypothetical protein